MRVACVLVTHLRAKVEMYRHPHLKDVPVVIVDRGNLRWTRPLVVDRFPKASGVRAGMTLEEAVSRHSNAVVLDADEPYYRRVFGQMLSALQGVSDRVEGADLGTAYVRIDGLEGLYGGEARVVSALLNAAPAYLSPRVGVADAKFPAFVAAWTCGAHGAFRVPEDVGTFLAPHSIDLLPISEQLKRELHRFGLHTMGAVASMSQYMLADRFGPEGQRAWLLCNGLDDSYVVPLAFQESVVEHTSLPFHSSSMDALFVAVDTLLKRAYSRPDVRGRYAGAADILCEASGWPSWEKGVRFRQPIGAWERASFAIRSRLEIDHPHNPVEDVTAHTVRLHRRVRDADGAAEGCTTTDTGGLVETDRRLQALMGGRHALYRVAEVAPWHPAPEMRALQIPIDPSGKDAIRTSERAQAHRGAGESRGRAGVGAGQETLAAGGADRRQVDVRPVVASPAYNPLLLPDRHGRRHVVDPVPRPAGRTLVSAERMMATGYVELHAKSFYSFGVGASHTHELLAQAKEHGYPALALTDTNLCGALEFARLANSLDIQPITGGELTLTDGSRLTLLARTRAGYSNISRLFTIANAADRREPRLDPSYLPLHAEGVILLTGGRDGALSRLAMDGRVGEAEALLKRYLEWYGTGSVYVELNRNLLQGDADRNRALVRIAREMGVPLVASNDVHYHAPERYRLQNALVAARLNTTIDRALPHLRPNHHLHLKSPCRDGAALQGVPRGREQHPARIAERCAFDLSRDLGYTLPDPAVPEGYTAESYLQRLCYEAAARRYGSVPQRVEERLQEEFRLIERLNLAGFLLLYREIALLAQRIMEERGLGRPRDAHRGEAPGKGARLLGGAPGGIPHRHQPRGPPEVGPHPGAVHLGGYDHSPRYRPRLPQGAEGRAYPEGAPPLRAGVRRPHRGDYHLQGKGHCPGPGQGPGASPGASLPALEADPLPRRRRPTGGDGAAAGVQRQVGRSRLEGPVAPCP